MNVNGLCAIFVYALPIVICSLLHDVYCTIQYKTAVQMLRYVVYYFKNKFNAVKH